MAKLDQAVISLLNLDPDKTAISNVGGGSGFAATSIITTTLPDGSKKYFFMKSGKGSSAQTMFRGEHTSLNAISSIVPTLSPKSHAYGSFQSSNNTFFLITDWLDLVRHGPPSGPSLAQKLAKLHSIPAPIPEGYDEPQFGFPVTTCCGDTPQDNTFSSSWAEFYAHHRLRFIVRYAESRQGKDKHLASVVERVCEEIVPLLLGSLDIIPVVVHGDLWSGNASTGKLPGMSESEAVVYDSSACYAHSEFELGIMKMFGGFGKEFMEEYHELVPRTQPVEEYEDRVRLYELYHHLNHYAMFGGGYKGGAVRIMEGLLQKYGSERSEL